MMMIEYNTVGFSCVSRLVVMVEHVEIEIVSSNNSCYRTRTRRRRR